MRIDYLGPLRVSVGAQDVDVRGRRLVALLVRLAMAPGRPVPVDLLADAVWPDGPPADPANALQSLVSRLRRALGDAGAVEQTPAGYRLAVEPEAVDAVRFGALAARGRRLFAAGDALAAAAALREALALWRGDPMPDAGEGADLEAERVTLRERRLAVLVDRVEADLRAGDVGPVTRELDELAAALPLREDVAALRMRALLDAGRPAQALLAFEAAREALAETLGADPSPALRALHLEALRQDGGTTTPPTTLRRPVTSFVGRDDDLLALARDLARSRLVTLTGAGGSGKTRLATEVAARVLDGGAPPAPDGVWFVELAPVTDPADLATAVLDGLGVREVAGETAIGLETAEPRRRLRARERVGEALAGRTCLVVLDNCEHLVAAAADLAADVLTRAPGVRLLATSREPLGVDGEAVHPLSPLAVPAEGATGAEVLASPAVRLLLDRAAAAGAPALRDEEALAAIVRRLDGLPLALELAAARLRLLSPAEVAARLDDRFRLLTGGRRTALPRHRTLRAVVEWSWDLLTDVEREVADSFCVFPGGATAEAVAAVCPTWDGAPEPAEVTDVLQGLVDKSLLVADHGPDGTRLRMLETLREYGAEQLAAQGLGDAARDAAARYAVELVERCDGLLRGPGQGRALRALDAERENLAAALAHLVDRGDAAAALGLVQHLGWFWMLREHAEDALRWTSAVLALPGAIELPLAPVVRALRVAVAAAVPRSEARSDARLLPGNADSVETFATAADALAAGPDEYPPARVLRPLLMFFAERRDEALRLVDERVRTDPDPWVRAATRSVRIAFAENEGDLATMRADVEAGVREWTELGDLWGMATVLSARGQLKTLDGDLDGAAADFEEARRRLQVLGTASDDLMVHMRLADLRLRAGDTEGARAHVVAMRLSRAPGELQVMRDVMADVLDGSVALLEDDAVAVAAVRERLLGALADVGWPSPFQAHATAVGHGGLAELELFLGDVDAAAAAAATGYEHAVQTNDLPILAAVGLAATAGLALRVGRPLDAAEVVGACARLRGADDAASPSVRRLVAKGRRQAGDAAWDEAYARGRVLGRAEAVARLDPALLQEDGAASLSQ